MEELIAFWTFLKRAFDLETADDVLGYLNDIPEEMFIEAMFDPARSGMGKSLVMAGTAAGYDMSNEVELNKFMVEYNARVLSEDPPEYDDRPSICYHRKPPANSALFSGRGQKKEEQTQTDQGISQEKSQRKEITP